MSKTIRIRNPRTGEYDYSLAISEPSSVAATVARLRDHQPAWSGAGVEHRIAAMNAFGQAITDAHDDIFAALSADTGRRSLAHGEVGAIGGMIQSWSQLAPMLMHTEESPSRAIPAVGLQQRHSPYPVLGVISPWNFPLLLSFIDAIPALLAGCAVAIKPSEVTPRFAEPLRKCIAKVPELANVLAIVDGDGSTGAALVENVDAIAFTGSVATGRRVGESAATSFIPAFLELGGKDPAVVLPGSDLERCTTAILRASIIATGQACQSIERIYVHDSQYDAFVKLLAEKAGAVRLSYPDAARGEIGPIIFERQAVTLRDHLKDALAHGAELHTGGEVTELGGGLWLEPTVLGNVNHEMRVMREETFGPIMPVMRYSSTDEALMLANDSEFGLSAAVFGPDESETLAFAAGIEAGGISINDAGMTTMIFESPKSAFKFSGIGASRMGPTGLTRFLRQQALYINRGDVMPITARAEDA